MSFVTELQLKQGPVPHQVRHQLLSWRARGQFALATGTVPIHHQTVAANTFVSSGAGGDGPDQLYRLATEGPIDAIFSDYLAEVNIAWRALEMESQPELGYEQGFLNHLNWKNAAEEVVKRGIKLVHDGGALNPRGLYEATRKLFEDKGFNDVKIAWVDGDNVTEAIKAGKESFQHLDIGDFNSADLETRVLSANAYIGMRGILAALDAGAQIVICGRCCDASPVMGLAAW